MFVQSISFSFNYKKINKTFLTCMKISRVRLRNDNVLFKEIMKLQNAASSKDFRKHLEIK